MHSDNGPHMAYDIGGQRWVKDAPGFAEAIEDAHAARRRPRCQCVPEGVEMYVARLAGPQGGYIVKRMPGTGYRHATDCPTYEPSAEHSGLGQFLGCAIVEDPRNGQTSLKLDIPLSKMSGRHRTPSDACDSGRHASDGGKLSLWNLLQYLWDRADLNRWHPGFAGKRRWVTVRRHLLSAACHVVANGEMLRDRLYLPEPFSVEHRDAIRARRLSQWTHALAQRGNVSPLMLLIGEVKEIVPLRNGFKLVVKHLPDQAFTIDESQLRRMERRFATELDLWGTVDSVRLSVIATFGLDLTGSPYLDVLALMALTPEWLPIATLDEAHLVRELVQNRRCFVKTLVNKQGKTTDTANTPVHTKSSLKAKMQ